MEAHERDKINTNLSSLIKHTSCNTSFLTAFEERNILYRDDAETLAVSLKNEGCLAQSKKFYEIIQTRVGAYSILLQVLRETNQSGTLKILKSGVEEKSSKRARTLFYVRAPNFLLNFLSPRNKATTLVISTDDCDITRQRILETVQGTQFFNVTEFIHHISSNINATEMDNNTPVITCEEGWKKIRNTLSFSRKKVFVINKSDLDEIRVILLRLPTNSVSFAIDVLEWDDLSAYLQAKVEETLEEFQLPDECVAALPHVKGKALFDLIKGKRPTLFKDTLPEPLRYYVPRKLITRMVICESVLTDEGPDIFLMKGVERHELSELAKGKATDTSSNMLHQTDADVKLILLEHEDHFDMIAEKLQHRPVHVISKQKEKFIWLRSSGGIHTIQQAVHNDQIIITEENFLQNIISSYTFSKTLICVSETPGMGKTVLLANFGRSLQQAEAGGTTQGSVAFVLISELVTNTKKIPVELGLGERVFCALAEVICENELAVAFFRKNKSNLKNLLLDGLDELKTEDVKFGYEILTSIREQFPATRVWVSTRPHMFDQLEKTFNVLGYNIEPFNEEDQIQFLDLYWSHSIHQVEVRTKLPSFAKYCLQKLKSTMSTEYSETIAGVPLQCLLIAEVFQEDARRYCETNNSEFLVASIKTLADLYDQLINKKFEIFYRKYDKDDFNYAQLTRAHVYLSIMLLFPNFIKKLGPDFNLPTMCLPQIFNVGILESKSFIPTPRFIHRTFAEFFVAKFLVECLTQSMTKSQFGLLLQVLKTHTASVKVNKVQLKSRQFKYNVICYFINAQLEQNFKFTLSNELTTELPDFKNILTAAVYNNFESIFRLLCHFGTFKRNIAGLITRDIMMLCASTAGRSTVSKLCKLFTTVNSTSLIDIKIQDYTLVHIAVICGNYSAFEVLLANETFKYSIVSTNKEFKDILSCCLNKSKKQNEKVVNHKCETVKRLVKLGFNLPNFIFKEELIIYLTSIHINLLVLLIQLIPIVSDENVIHRLSHKLTKLYNCSEYQQLIRQIKSTKGPAFIVRCLNTSFKSKPLIYKILSQMNCDVRMLQFLKDNGLNFSSYEIDDLYFLESVAKKSTECLEWLLNNCSALKNNIPKYFWFSYDTLSLTRCRYLLDKKLVDPTSLYKEDKIMLHRLIKKGTDVAVETCQLAQCLVANGIDIDRVQNDATAILQLMFQTKPTMHAFVFLKTFRISWDNPVLVLEKLTWFLKLSTIQDYELFDQYLSCFTKEIRSNNLVDNTGNTLVHLAAEQNNNAALTYFLRLGAYVNTKNSEGETALQSIALQCGSNISIVCWQTLIDHNADPTILDKRRYTPICYLRDSKLSVVKYALKRFHPIEFHKTSSIFLLSCYKFSLNQIKDLCDWYTFKMKKLVRDIQGDFKGKKMTVLDVVFRRYDGDFLEYFVREHRCTEMTKPIDTLIFDGKFVFFRLPNNALKFVTVINSVYPDVFTRPNKEGFYPLSVKKFHPDYVNLLVSVGANINSTDKDGNTPLHWALKHNEWPVRVLVESLINAGADVNAVASNGETPLFLTPNISDSCRFRDLVKMLIENKADVSHKDSSGNTILHLLPPRLHEYQFFDIVKYLLEHGHSELFKVCNNNGLTAIQIASRHFTFCSEHLALLRHLDSDFE